MSSAAALGRVTDRAANHDVIGARKACATETTFLVVGRFSTGRMPGVMMRRESMLSQQLRFQARRDHAIAPGLERTARAREHKLLDIAIKSQVIEIATIQAGQHRNREHLDVALGFRGGLHDRLIAMHGREVHAAIAQLANRRRNGGRHVEEFQVDEHLIPSRHEPVEQREVFNSY
jgi:hypothetical protein